jgi:hypothetical protein
MVETKISIFRYWEKESTINELPSTIPSEIDPDKIIAVIKTKVAMARLDTIEYAFSFLLKTPIINSTIDIIDNKISGNNGI